MNLTIDTCVVALSSAAINRKAAIQLELSVGLAVFHMYGGTNREARTALKDTYSAAGYQCSVIADRDYTTVNRRINATASLYEKVPVAKWIGQLSEMDILAAIAEGLSPYELHSVQDVVRFAGQKKREYKRRTTTAVQPAHDLLSGLGAPSRGMSGHERVLQQFRRAGDQIAEGSHRVATEHLSLNIPKDVAQEEIIDLAMQLLSLTKNNSKELLTA